MSTIGYYPLFCTTPQLSLKLIQKLMTEARDVDYNVQNCFVLVASPDQQSFNRGLKPLTKPISCGFVGAEIEHLAGVSAQRFNDKLSDENNDKINQDMFVVIDERTLEDGTLRVVQSDLGPVYDEDGEIVSDEDVDRLETVRCEIRQVGWLLALLQEEVMIQFKVNQEVPLRDDDVAVL
ncbi:unnamed protein product [Aureobasidium vineae]|uniref:Uncharacterized protein n=1 Tax=Aureobasidium vineae TaxID=2773715 RepID=A0A9N8JJA0_9PEZI|nr:unnamed protein product [Aureobasidium vineae]